MEFVRATVYELARTGGGRVHTGIVFPEARFPVEAKHEFYSLAPQHVRERFVLYGSCSRTRRRSGTSGGRSCWHVSQRIVASMPAYS
jgi:hypothetical protein